MVDYKINEIFETIQGEGYFTGVPSIFIRLQGCPVGCSWCDTQHTWEVKEELQIPFSEIVEKSSDEETWCGQSAQQLLSHIQQNYTSKHIVITGGEPCMYDLNELTGLLISNDYTCQIETSGTFEVQAHKHTWVTVSPKVKMKGGYKVLASAMQRADEIKHPVATTKHIEQLDELLEGIENLECKVVCLQPISQKENATKLAIETCIKRNWRLSVQSHKYIGIA